MLYLYFGKQGHKLIKDIGYASFKTDVKYRFIIDFLLVLMHGFSTLCFYALVFTLICVKI